MINELSASKGDALNETSSAKGTKNQIQKKKNEQKQQQRRVYILKNKVK